MPKVDLSSSVQSIIGATDIFLDIDMFSLSIIS